MKSIKIAVALSGGVDSSVAAALICQKYGKENVFGLTLKLFPGSESATIDAKAVCKSLGIKHYVIDAREQFDKVVIKPFISEYSQGKTPIPCIYCNPKVKFQVLFSEAKKYGATKIATGHYARIKEAKGNIWLLKGVNFEKDQSYFLYRLTKNQLENTIFPLGEMTKQEVRKKARELGLKTAEKKDSQGICFISNQTVADYIRETAGATPGNIVDTKGEVIGKHQGIVFYTIGQRKRIGGGFAEPMFVVGINPRKNEVIIGPKKELYGKKLVFENPYFASTVKFPLKCTAKIRYNTKDERCKIKGNVASFKKPQRAITPGQSIVFYNKDICLGGAIIADKS